MDHAEDRANHTAQTGGICSCKSQGIPCFLPVLASRLAPRSPEWSVREIDAPAPPPGFHIRGQQRMDEGAAGQRLGRRRDKDTCQTSPAALWDDRRSLPAWALRRQKGIRLFRYIIYTSFPVSCDTNAVFP